ncbi:hypothetical protein DUNSADRAFT_18172, partial [Dunaliella salina]
MEWQRQQGLLQGLPGDKVLRFDPAVGPHGAFYFADVQSSPAPFVTNTKGAVPEEQGSPQIPRHHAKKGRSHKRKHDKSAKDLGMATHESLENSHPRPHHRLQHRRTRLSSVLRSAESGHSDSSSSSSSSSSKRSAHESSSVGEHKRREKGKGREGCLRSTPHHQHETKLGRHELLSPISSELAAPQAGQRQGGLSPSISADGTGLTADLSASLTD